MGRDLSDVLCRTDDQWAQMMLDRNTVAHRLRAGRGAGAAILVLVAAAALTVLIAWSTHGTGSRERVFVQDPYMGVSCHVPNSVACDRVGLSVWLARPASVTATIAGTPLRLNDPRWSHVARQGGKLLYMYAGFIRPAGITSRLHVTPTGQAQWLGAHSPRPLVHFRIEYGDGDVVTTQERVVLHPGWG
jgi:hypothetical protein